MDEILQIATITIHPTNQADYNPFISLAKRLKVRLLQSSLKIESKKTGQRVIVGFN
ncbi:hypothetical protein GCM10027035_43730 [Emticicia sediminis]